MPTQFSFHRPLWSYEKVRRFIAFVQHRRRSQFRKPSVRSKRYLDIGCGPNPHDNFINLDFRWSPEIDVSWDVTRGLPFQSESLRGIFSEHCLEHLPLVSTPSLLRECYRILEPGGTIRIVVPDAELYLRRYSSGETLPYSESDAFNGAYSPILSVNRIFRDHGHQFLYDTAFLISLLECAGFSNLKRESLGSGRDATLLIDTQWRAVESLYIEGSKPVHN